MGTTHSSAVNAVAAAAASGAPSPVLLFPSFVQLLVHGTSPLRSVLLPGGQPTLPQQQGKKPPGRHLPAGRTVSIDVDEQEAPPQQLEVQPITMYNTEASMELRRFVAASASYICYGLKAGQLRVLHRATAARALLRGHTAPVTDLRRAWC